MELRGKLSHRQSWGTADADEQEANLSESCDGVELEADCSSDDDSRRGRSAISWKGSLESRFLKALQQAGGVWEAKPKAILQKMGAYATQLTTIQVKSHLQKHRIKVAAEMQRQTAASGGTGGPLPPGMAAGGPGPSPPLQQARQAAQLQAAAARQAGAGAAATGTQPKPRRRPQKAATGRQAELLAGAAGPAAAAARKSHQPHRRPLQHTTAARPQPAAQRPPSASGPGTPQKMLFDGNSMLALRHSAPAVLGDTASSGGQQRSPVSGGSSSSGGGMEQSRSHYSLSHGYMQGLGQGQGQGHMHTHMLQGPGSSLHHHPGGYLVQQHADYQPHQPHVHHQLEYQLQQAHHPHLQVHTPQQLHLPVHHPHYHQDQALQYHLPHQQYQGQLVTHYTALQPQPHHHHSLPVRHNSMVHLVSSRSQLQGPTHHHVALTSQPTAPAALWGGASLAAPHPAAPSPAPADSDGGWMDQLLGEVPPPPGGPSALHLSGGSGRVAASPSPLLTHQHPTAHQLHPHQLHPHQLQLQLHHQTPQRRPAAQHQPGSDSDSDHFHPDVGELLDIPALRPSLMTPQEEATFGGLLDAGGNPAASSVGGQAAAWALDPTGLF
ncbi:hypothetical protein ACK3TF_001669 [Chlorella vulgaris]